MGGSVICTNLLQLISQALISLSVVWRTCCTAHVTTVEQCVKSSRPQVMITVDLIPLQIVDLAISVDFRLRSSQAACVSHRRRVNIRKCHKVSQNFVSFATRNISIMIIIINKECDRFPLYHWKGTYSSCGLKGGETPEQREIRCQRRQTVAKCQQTRKYPGV